ncbi:MAG: aminopeptidase P family protein [Elusimicrobia bacterium]|nr:aminopeptidase P family protein [Elusimicrobiota bacterium]
MTEMTEKAFLVVSPKNLSYITGADFEGFWLFIFGETVTVITSEMIKGQIVQAIKEDKFSCRHLNKNSQYKIEICVARKTFSDAVVDICKQNNINSVVLDIIDVNYSLFQYLDKKFKENNFSLITDDKTLPTKRIIKDDDEIKNIQKACDIVSEVFNVIKHKVKPGMTELDIHFEIEKEFASRHVVQSFKTIVASGPNSANPHHSSGTRKVQEQDIVLIDMGCIYNGYCSDLTRTFFVGTLTDEQTKIWNIVKLAHDEALKNVKAGIKASDIDGFARNIIEKECYGEKFIHTTGHGVGLDIHEAPSVGKISKDTLSKNMVITIEPGIYLNDNFGVRIEDTVLVTETGYKILTSAEY